MEMDELKENLDSILGESYTIHRDKFNQIIIHTGIYDEEDLEEIERKLEIHGYDFEIYLSDEDGEGVIHTGLKENIVGELIDYEDDED